MRRILFTLCVVFVFITSATAGELYNCIDRDGNTVITSSPQDGMTNCALKDSYDNPAPSERGLKQEVRAQKQRIDEIENKQQQAQIIQEETMRKENERQKAIQDSKNREAEKYEKEARNLGRGPAELEERKSCLLANAERVRRGDAPIQCPSGKRVEPQTIFVPGYIY